MIWRKIESALIAFAKANDVEIEYQRDESFIKIITTDENIVKVSLEEIAKEIGRAL